MKPVVAYYRVSSKQQGESGLGLEAQQSIVRHYGTPIEEFTEVETATGKKHRPQLQAALVRCRELGCRLVIAKLDRLARNTLFICQLLESGVEFEACDLPSANRLTIQIMAAVAEEEARLISQRTKAALAAAKARGVKLGGYRGSGGWDPTDSQQQEVKRQAFFQRYGDVLPLAQELRAAGQTYKQIAATLSRRGVTGPKGAAFSVKTIHRVLNSYHLGVTS